MSLKDRSIALVEDDPIMGESLVQMLSLEGALVTWWRSGGEAIAASPRHRPEAVICDLRLPDVDGEQVFLAWANSEMPPPFVFITGFGDIDQAVRLMKGGAGDFLTKPFEKDVFLERLADLLPRRSEFAGACLGVSPPMRSVQRLLDRIAKVRSTVLITGETGTGKEVAARYLHGASSSGELPFVAINCAAIPADLLESELFGHERGAFTGAGQRHLGYAERAGGGTLFLDEVGELRPELQAKLLRLVEERTFRRVGGEKDLAFSARLVAATNSDLQAAVAIGRFRKDLLFRLDVLNVAVPPLRERKEDIAWLLDRFFEEFAALVDTPLRGVSALTEQAAADHPWPGNVRELRNRVERAVALGLGPWLMPSDLFPEALQHQVVDAFGSLAEVRNEAERRHIERALGCASGEMARAAKILGIGRTTLWEKMQKLGLRAG
ncbi:sigma-54-dependent transcriptional regulator [Consotaella salsifontis]|uniref:Two component, sigma54 specific, transcriptional regulator, Fis family n=1 Tax=Consotaella salsifontis TaxID=1365950 RepID=A0A1T4SFH3_9HYPH|nr:sigma-54 dependent transcriptional regulator [Consotaella salsifontis]SKA26581.1 two component, sigma54 specific, transcriptional regulator, Fis family [Consotaella salsifontis]